MAARKWEGYSGCHTHDILLCGRCLGTSHGHTHVQDRLIDLVPTALGSNRVVQRLATRAAWAELGLVCPLWSICVAVQGNHVFMGRSSRYLAGCSINEEGSSVFCGSGLQATAALKKVPGGPKCNPLQTSPTPFSTFRPAWL